MENSINHLNDMSGVKSIYCHPDTLARIEASIPQHNKNTGEFIMNPINIVVSDNIPATEIIEGEYVREAVIPDTSFCEMVDTKNPPEWAIYFGLVAPKTRPVCYMVRNYRFVMQQKIESHIHRATQYGD